MTGSIYLRRKRILGISAIVLAMLLVALPAFTRAAEVETALNENFSKFKFIDMCTEAGLTSLSDITEVRCVTARDGDGWVECGESTDPNMICVRVDGTAFEIFVPEELTKVTSEPNLDFAGGNPNRFSGADPFDMDPLLSILDTSNYTSMQEMFAGIAHAESLDVSNFNTANVNSMLGMFTECGELRSLELTGFDTSGVINMNNMFWSCSGLEALDLSSFNTETVTDMEEMFYGCSSLTELDLNSFTVNAETNVTNMLTGCTSLNIIRTPKITAKEIILPDTYYHLLEDGSWEMDETNTENKKAYTVIPVNSTDENPKSIILIKEAAIPTITPEAILPITPSTSPTGEAEASPSAETSPTVSPSPEVTGAAEVSPSPSPVIPTPTRKPTQTVRNNSLTIVDNRADKTGTNQIAATVSNLVGNLKLIIEDDDGADIKKIQTLNKDQTLVPYNIYIIDENGNRYNNFGSCTITMPVPSSMDLTQGTVKMVAAVSSNVLENVPSTKLVKNNTNCLQFTATAFGEYGFLYTPKSLVTEAVTSPTPSVTTSPTPSTTKSATPKPSTTKGASGGSSGSSDKKDSSSSSSSSGSSAKPVAGVKGYSNAKDMPKTGDGDVFRILGAVILFLFGSIELISSIREKTAE